MSDSLDRLWSGSMPAIYDRYLGPVVFQPFAKDLANRVIAFKPRRVLELAAGTGLATRELIRTLPDAQVCATDLNSAMVTYGTSHVPGAQWEEANAESLPFPDTRFDLVVCQFGVMFFPDKVRAFTEVNRVLMRDGSFVFNSWAAVDTHRFARELNASLEEVFPGDAPRFVSAVPHGYADVALIADDLGRAGLVCETAETVTLEGVGTAADLAVGFCTGTPLRAEIEARADLADATASVTSAMESRLGTGPVVGKMTAHVFQARKVHRSDLPASVTALSTPR